MEMMYRRIIAPQVVVVQRCREDKALTQRLKSFLKKPFPFSALSLNPLPPPLLNPLPTIVLLIDGLILTIAMFMLVIPVPIVFPALPLPPSITATILDLVMIEVVAVAVAVVAMAFLIALLLIMIVALIASIPPLMDHGLLLIHMVTVVDGIHTIIVAVVGMDIKSDLLLPKLVILVKQPH